MDYAESYVVAVLGNSRAVEKFFHRLEVLGRDPKNVHISTPSGLSDADLVVGYIPDLAPMNLTAISQLHAGGYGGVATKGARRVAFHLFTNLIEAPDMIVTVVDTGADAAATGGLLSSPQSPSAVGKIVGETGLAALDSAALAVHELCPLLAVDLADDCNYVPAMMEVSTRLSRRLQITADGTFAGIVPFAAFESFVEGDGEDDYEQDNATPAKGSAGKATRELVDPAAVITSLYNTLVCPRHCMWDAHHECIRPDFVAHFRRCFWMFDKNKDGFLDATPSLQPDVIAPEVGTGARSGELHAAIEAMFGICTDEDLKDVLSTLQEAEAEMRGEGDDEDADTDQALIVIGEHPAAPEDGLDEPVPPFKVSEAGFIQYLHSLLAIGDQHSKAIWYMLKSFGHSPALKGYLHTVDDLVGLQRARVRAATDILHNLGETTPSDIVADDDEDAEAIGQMGGRLFLTSKVLQGQLSPTGVAFFASLFPSGPRVATCKPAAFGSLQSLWDVVPPSFVTPWGGVAGMPQLEPWLDRADELMLHKKQGSRSYNSYTSKYRLENLYRFLECWEWAASGAVFMPRPAVTSGAVAPTHPTTNTWWRQEAVIMFARQWGFRGDASKLFVFRPVREFREGRAGDDGFPRLIHTCVIGAPGAGKSALMRLITYDGCDKSDFLADDDEHDIPTVYDDADGGEDDGAGHDASGGMGGDGIVVSSVTIETRDLARAAGVAMDKAAAGHHRGVDDGLTTIYFYEIPSDQQAALFVLNDTSDTSASARNHRAAAAPTSAAALWQLMNKPSVLQCMDICLALFDGTNPLGVNGLAEVWSRGTPFSQSFCNIWTSRMRLPIVPVLTKADELPVGQIVEPEHLAGTEVQLSGAQRATTRRHASAEARAADIPAAYCAANGLTWPPLITSAMSEALHPHFNVPGFTGSVSNAADSINTMLVELGSMPCSVVGARVSRAEKEAEEAIERAAVVTRRIIAVTLGVTAVVVVGKVIGRLFRGSKK